MLPPRISSYTLVGCPSGLMVCMTCFSPFQRRLGFFPVFHQNVSLWLVGKLFLLNSMQYVTPQAHCLPHNFLIHLDIYVAFSTTMSSRTWPTNSTFAKLFPLKAFRNQSRISAFVPVETSLMWYLYTPNRFFSLTFLDLGRTVHHRRHLFSFRRMWPSRTP